MENKIWSISELLKISSELLEKKNIETPKLNTELLLSNALNLSRIELYTNFDRKISNDELQTFKKLFQQRLEKKPLQYILGETTFFGLKFFVNENVLIPRQETEILVEEVIDCGKQINNKINILEIGTGSGNIAISIAKFLNECKITSVDIDENAIQIANKNAIAQNISEKINFLKMDFFKIDANTFENKFDFVVSNPPYISNKEFKLLPYEVKNFEPKIALTDFNDGLSFFKKISEIGKFLLTENGEIFVEIAYNQSEVVKNIFLQKYSSAKTKKDYNNIERIVIVKT